MVRQQTFARADHRRKSAARVADRIALARRGHYSQTISTASLRRERRSRFVFFVARGCLAEIILILVPALLFSRLENLVALGDRIDPWLRAYHIFGWATMTGIVLLLITAIHFVKLPGHGLWFRAHAILLAIGGIAFGLFCWQYHLLDASLKF